MSEQTDAQKLAAAETLMAEAAAQAKAARLPSAEAAVELLTGEEGQAFLSALKDCVAASIDDIPRPLGTQGVEGTKQMLQRIITSFEGAVTAGQARVATLQPTPAALPVPEAQDQTEV